MFANDYHKYFKRFKMRSYICFSCLFFMIFACCAQAATGFLCEGCMGFCPGSRGLAVMPNGTAAYVSFSQEDTVLKIDLSSFNVVSKVDVSSAGYILDSGVARISPDGSQLWIANHGTRNIMVIDTANDQVLKVIPISPNWGASINFTSDNKYACLVSESGIIYLVSLEGFSTVQVSPSEGYYFGVAVPSPVNSGIIYGQATVTNSDDMHRVFYELDINRRAVVRTVMLSQNVSPRDVGLSTMVISPDGEKAFWGWVKFSGECGYGNVTAFEIGSFTTIATKSTRYGVCDLVYDHSQNQIYVSGFYSGGNTPEFMPLDKYDANSLELIGSFRIGESSASAALALDTSRSGGLLMTESDFNLLRRIDLSSGSVNDVVRFHNSTLRPMTIVKGDGKGYVLCLNSPKVFVLDMEQAQIVDSFYLPSEMSSGNINAGYKDGLLRFVFHGMAYWINPGTGKLTKTKELGLDLMAAGHITFFKDMAAIIDSYPGGYVGRRVVFFDEKTMEIRKMYDLNPHVYDGTIIAAPDGSKLYYAQQDDDSSNATIYFVDGASLAIYKTLYIPVPKWRAGGIALTNQGYFDEKARRLYLIGWGSIYVIDMDTDQLLDVLNTIDVNDLVGRANGWSPTALFGISPDSSGEKIMVAAMDSHCLYTYDVASSSWLAEIVNYKGYQGSDAAANDSNTLFYTINGYTDNISVVDLNTRKLVKVIELQ